MPPDPDDPVEPTQGAPETQSDANPPADDSSSTAGEPSGMEAALEALRGELAEAQTQLSELAAARDQAVDVAAERAVLIAEIQSATDAATQRELTAHRRALLAENAGQVIAELVNGSTVDELEASIDLARSAYARIAQDLRAQAAAHVPVGAAAGQATAPEELSALAKITQGLTRNGR